LREDATGNAEILREDIGWLAANWVVIWVEEVENLVLGGIWVVTAMQRHVNRETRLYYGQL
jgi:hypothetical protein